MPSYAHVWTDTFHQVREQHVWPFALRTLAHEQPHAALGRSRDVAMAKIRKRKCEHCAAELLCGVVTKNSAPRKRSPAFVFSVLRSVVTTEANALLLYC